MLRILIVTALLLGFSLPVQAWPRIGTASTYGNGDGYHGKLTASGERYDQWQLTAAHKTLPFGTKIKVTNMRNGKTVVVRITDRGPFTPGRIIDLSTASARALGMYGLTLVKLELI